MSESHPPPGLEPTLRGTLAGDGQPGPIEQRIGRRLVRLVDPLSDEGRTLLDSGQVEWIGPDGSTLGRIPPDVIYALLRERLERVLRSPGEGGDLREALVRLEGWSARLGRS
jgi:hypothetical protein